MRMRMEQVVVIQGGQAKDTLITQQHAENGNDKEVDAGAEHPPPKRQGGAGDVMHTQNYRPRDTGRMTYVRLFYDIDHILTGQPAVTLFRLLKSNKKSTEKTSFGGSAAGVFLG